MGRAANDVGIRGRIALNTMDMDDSLPANYRMTTSQALKENEALVKRWKNHPRVNAWLSLRPLRGSPLCRAGAVDFKRNPLPGRNDFDQYPSTDPLVTLAEMTTGRDVRTVIVDGRVVMKDREFLTIDMGPMRRRMAKQYKVILDRYDQSIS